MSSTTKLTSQAPLLISCTLPLAISTQQPAGSFPERTAIPFSLPQSCPPDFPMPDIWKWYCTGPSETHSFAPIWLSSCFGWNRPLIFGPVPAEKISGRLQTLAEDKSRPRQMLGTGDKSAHFAPMVRLRSTLRETMGALARRNATENGLPDYRRN
ncbi:hypothetical protein MUN82_19595 [Hymenobacter aerilatus]|uniref:Uncharacterized protein n=1 Tax=Hymenobacter aerilatus TaxID=2932251 RepID=A0A8T9SSL3_9BACT|nr:hypothetical protein [Hymenobacter aerilatus]UOR05128.1 hypothetical protein MUN82_19595 [Hymenobacter aerilatus]